MEIIVKQFNNPELQTFELDKCLKRLKKELDKDKTLTDYKERQFYKKPSEKRREKQKIITSLMKRRQRKKDAWEAKWGDAKFIPRRPEATATENRE
jgi:ribosomal protein S21